jgi:hypothetical protein
MDKLNKAAGYEQGHGFSIRDYMERYHLTYSSADTRLTHLVNTGKLIQGWGHRNGRRSKVYQLVEVQ